MEYNSLPWYYFLDAISQQTKYIKVDEETRKVYEQSVDENNNVIWLEIGELNEPPRKGVAYFKLLQTDENVAAFYTCDEPPPPL